MVDQRFSHHHFHFPFVPSFILEGSFDHLLQIVKGGHDTTWLQAKVK